ncbi:hypothetical protein HYH02_006973 [Chlamydomonas schloesseri]|uniref:Uncharacterized protein n=1 Tax=Chlamydomonas schloesseri TaxID=2026947 RepID=A0A835WI36_9CHLO|nr:hypothetical protein HYH02_006973 [Chlamydomonas schloesseri]|eukprot:KAG2447942.1 hypothetical protein HYH02_006973 [Chlamydomonas schloesseri]
MPRAWLLLLQCVEELNNLDVSVRHRGLDGEGCEGTYGSITFRCLLKLVWDCVAHGDLPDPMGLGLGQADVQQAMTAPAVVPGPGPGPTAAAAAAVQESGTVGAEAQPDLAGAPGGLVAAAEGGATGCRGLCGGGGGGGAGEGGCLVPVPVPVPQRPGRVVDFGAGTGRALVLLQALNLVEAGVGFEVDGTKTDKAELYMTQLLAAAAAAGMQGVGPSSGSAGAAAGTSSASPSGRGAGGGGGGGSPLGPAAHGSPPARGNGSGGGGRGGSSPARQLLPGVIGGIGRGRGQAQGRGRGRGRGRRGRRSNASTILSGGGAGADVAGPSAAGPPQPPQPAAAPPQRLQVLCDLSLRADVPLVLQADLVQLPAAALLPHAPSWGYAFWAGVPPRAQAAIWRLFMGCASMTTLLLVGYGDRTAATLARLMEEQEQGEQAQEQGQGQNGRQVVAVLRRVISNVASMGGNGCYSAFVVRKCALIRRGGCGVAP